MSPRTKILAALVALTAWGCSHSDDDAKGPDPAPPPGAQPPAPPPAGINTEPDGIPSPNPSTLTELHSCADVAGAIKRDVLHKMNDAIDAQIGQLKLWYDQPVSSGMGMGGVADSAGGSSSGGMPTPSAPPSSGGAKESSPGSTTPVPPATDYSTTNTQVAGVDEADIVKNDGQYIYVLHGNTFQVLTAWPATSLATAAKLVVDGNPTEMFVANKKAVIFSTMEPNIFYGDLPIPKRAFYYDRWGYYPWGGYYYGYPVTKVTILDVDGTKASVSREYYFEGSYLSSRRIGDSVKVVLQGGMFGPDLQTYPDYSKRAPNAGPMTKDEQIQAYEDLRAKNKDLIDKTTPDTWLPYSFWKDGGGIHSQLASCDHFWVPTESTTEIGVTQIATFDLAKPDPSLVGILGAVDTVYENDDAMVLAARAWISPKRTVERPTDKKAPFIDYMPSTATYLHRFDVKQNPNVPTYTGSGSVPGQVHDQFSIDQKGDTIRIATTEQRSVRSWISDDANTRPFVNNFNVNRVFALKTSSGVLPVVGDVGDLAPGESIQSARFVGDKGYVTTFRQIDPLFVIDLAKPDALKVLGHLEIPGFSEYMHPIDDNHLLTIGRDQGQWSGSLALQVFDVTNPTQPRLMHKFAYSGDDYGYSEAESNHKAFTYFASHQLLSFPFYGYGPNGFRSSAEVFKIDLANGITRLGSVDHTKLFGTYSRGWCGGYFSPEVRRTLFIENTLYSVSYGGVIASDVNNLAGAALATAALEQPMIVDYPYCVAYAY